VDVARTIGEKLADGDPHDELRLGIVNEERIGGVDGGHAVQAEALLTFEIDEQEADFRSLRDIAH